MQPYNDRTSLLSASDRSSSYGTIQLYTPQPDAINHIQGPMPEIELVSQQPASINRNDNSIMVVNTQQPSPHPIREVSSRIRAVWELTLDITAAIIWYGKVILIPAGLVGGAIIGTVVTLQIIPGVPIIVGGGFIGAAVGVIGSGLLVKKAQARLIERGLGQLENSSQNPIPNPPSIRNYVDDIVLINLPNEKIALGNLAMQRELQLRQYATSEGYETIRLQALFQLLELWSPVRTVIDKKWGLGFFSESSERRHAEKRQEAFLVHAFLRPDLLIASIQEQATRRAEEVSHAPTVSMVPTSTIR